MITISTCKNKIEAASEEKVPESGENWICGMTEHYGVDTEKISKDEAKELAQKAREYDRSRKEGVREFLGQDEDT